jgi:alpha-1,4-N-acetylglucosaminyltransferase EXTL3
MQRQELNGSLTYGGYDDHPYHFILTGSAFFHRNYLQLFTHHAPAAMLQYIDDAMNCEDLAMNFIVADRCRCSAIFHVPPREPIESPTHSSFLRKRLSARAEHYSKRSECLNFFARQYAEYPIRRGWCIF